MDRPEIAPSLFVQLSRRYLEWCEVSQCPDCGLVGKTEDMYPRLPCPKCGNKRIQRVVGRWVPKQYPKFMFWKWWSNEGHWQLKESVKE